MISTLGSAYQDILHRAGEGYAAYVDRARELFWRALATIVQSGEYSQTEVSNMLAIRSDSVSISSFPYSITVPPGVFQLSAEIFLSSAPGVHFSKVTNPAAMDDMSQYVLRMGKGAGIKEIIWSQYPDRIEIRYDADNQDLSDIDIEVKTISIEVDSLITGDGGDNQYISSVMAETLCFKAIEMATQLIVQELRG
ncbi:MAG: hypothetical protein PHX79_07255 [Sphaerochaetaceae bacterium]|jgi:hypothetical protein|nr:hypothetical protein [Sphaerochaetaceae bacterium]